MTDQEAKKLEVAIEGVRMMFLGDDPFHRLTNAHRSKDDEPADWTRGFANVFAHAPPPPGAPDHDAGSSSPNRQANAPKPPQPSPAAPSSTSPQPTPGNPAMPPPAPAVMNAVDPIGGRPVVIVGHHGAPIPVFMVGDRQDYLADRANRPDARINPWESGGKKPPMTEFGQKKAAESGGEVIAKALGRHFAFVLGPLTAFGTVLKQSNSGFGVFTKAVNLLGTSLAPLLLPPFILLSTLIIALAEKLQGKLMPAIEKAADWTMERGVPAVEDAAAAGEQSIDGLGMVKNFFTKGELPSGKDSLVHMYQGLKAADILGDLTGKDSLKFGTNILGHDPTKGIELLTGKTAEAMKMAGPGISEPSVPGATGSKPGELQKPGDVRSILKDVMKSLALSIGPAPGRYAIADVEKQRQDAASGADPIEMRAMRWMLDSLRPFMERAFTKMDTLKPPPAPPAPPMPPRFPTR